MKGSRAVGRVACALAAVLAAAIGAPAAGAEEATAAHEQGALHLEAQGHELPKGAPLEARSSDLSISNNAWRLSCTGVSLEGELLKDGDSVDRGTLVEGKIGGGDPKDPALCESSLEFVSTFNPHSGSRLELLARGAATLEHVRIKLLPREDEGHAHGKPIGCEVEAQRLSGSFSVGESPRPFTLTFSSAPMKLATAHGPECVAQGSGQHPALSASLTFYSDGEQVEVTR